MTDEKNIKGAGAGRALRLGALAGLLLTVPLVAIFYAADAFLGTPFVPFDVLDWAARNLPGGLITFAIDTMVSLIITLQLGETSTAAKAAEQLMGIAGMILTGVVIGALFFYAQRRNPGRLQPRAGFVPGLILGLPVALLSNAVNFSALTTPAVSFLWILVAFVAWGLALAALYNELLFSHAGSPTPAAEASVQALDRRSFLLRMGGAAATVTVVGAGVGALLRESGSTATPVRLASTGGGGDLPNADAALQPVPGTRAELTPVEKHYRIDISSRPPVLEEETWTLPVSGLVDNPLEMTLADLRSEFQPVDQYLTLACISNRVGGDLIGTQKWTGLRAAGSARASQTAGGCAVSADLRRGRLPRDGRYRPHQLGRAHHAGLRLG